MTTWWRLTHRDRQRRYKPTPNVHRSAMCESTVNVDTDSDGPVMRSGQADANGNPIARRVFKTACIYSSFLAMVRELALVNTFRVGYLHETHKPALYWSRINWGKWWGWVGKALGSHHRGPWRPTARSRAVSVQGGRARGREMTAIHTHRHTHTHT